MVRAGSHMHTPHEQDYDLIGGAVLITNFCGWYRMYTHEQHRRRTESTGEIERMGVRGYLAQQARYNAE